MSDICGLSFFTICKLQLAFQPVHTSKQDKYSQIYFALLILQEANLVVSLYNLNENIDQLNLKYSGAEIFESAVLNYPAIKVASYQTLAALQDIKIMRSSLLPRLSLQSTISSGYSSARQRALLNQGNLQYTKARIGYQLKDNLNEYIGIGLSIPVFNGLSSKIALKRSQINYHSLQLAEELEKNNLKKSLPKAF